MKASNQLTILNIEEQTYEDICTHDTATGLIECTHAQEQGCVRVEIQGKSEQVQSTLGKNLLDIYGFCELGGQNGVVGKTFKENNSTLAYRWRCSQESRLKLKPSTKYIFTIPTGYRIGIHHYGTNDLCLGDSGWQTGTYAFETPSNYLCTSYVISKNVEDETFDKSLLISLQVQLEEGTTATAYEPFIPNSPSPDYPSVINSVGDSGKLNVVSSVGRRNLIIGSSIPEVNSKWTVNGWGGSSFKEDKINKQFVLKATNGWCAARYDLNNYISQTLTLSFEAYLDEKSSTATTKDLYFANETAGMFGSEHLIYAVPENYNKWVKVSKTFKLNSTGKVGLGSKCTPENNNLQAVWYIRNLKIELGNEGTGFTPPPEDITPENSKQYEDKLSLATVNLASPLRSLPNGAHDVLECKDGVWGVTRNVGKIVLNGSESWATHNYPEHRPSNTYVYYIVLNNSIFGHQTSICSHFKNLNLAWDSGDVGTYSDYPTNARKYFVSNLPTVAEFKTWLSSNNITMSYPLGTPTWEPLDDPSQKALNNLVSYSGKDYIYTTDPLATNFSVAVKSRAFYENFKLQEEIKNTNSSLGDLDDEIKGGFYDGIINVNEAEAIRKAAETMHTQVTNQFNKVDSNPSLTGAPKTTHQTKYTECNNAYNTLISKINTAIDYCSVNSTKTEAQKKTAVTDMNTAFGTYKTKLADYQKAYQDAIDAIAKKKADDAVDGMQISSRNLALTSGGYKTGQTTKWIIDTAAHWGLTVNDGYVRFTKKTNVTGSWIRLPLSKSLESGKNYILKLKVRTSEVRNAPIHLDTAPGGNAYVIGTISTTANTWKTMTFPFKATTDTSSQLILTSTHFPTVNEKIDFEYLMLVEGDKVGDWMPAPEDADEKINQVSATLTSTIGDVKSIVDKNTKSITDKVWKTDIITGIKDLNVGGINLWDLSAIKRYASGGLNTIVAGTTVDAKTGKITVTADPQAVPGCKIDVSTLTRNSSNIGELIITGYFDRPDSDNNKLKNVYLYYRCFNNANAEIQAHTNKLVPVETSSNLFAGTLSIPANTAYINFGVGQIPYVKPYTLTGVTVKDSALYDITKGLRDQVSQAYQDISGFKQTVSDTYTTKTEFDQLSIGGRNLAVNDGITYAGGGNVFDKSQYLQSGSVTFDRGAVVNGGIAFDKADIYEPSTKYVLRFKAKLNSGSITNIYFHNGQGLLNASIYIDGVKQVKGLSIIIDCNFLDKNYHEIIVYFTTPAKLKDYMQSDNRTYFQPMKSDASATYNVTITELKIEKGTKFTDWTPPVEDVNAAIEKVDGKFTNYTTTTDMNSKFDQTKKAIEFGVSQTYTSKAEGDKITQGLNKWILEVYQLTSSSMPNPRVADIENIRGKVPTKIVEVADTAMSSSLNVGDYYIGHAFTYLYLDAAYTWSGTIKTDDEGVVYLNGVKKVSTVTSVATNITLPFQTGWNVLEVVYNEGTSNDGWLFSSKLSTLTQCKIMNCYAQVSLNASALIKVTADAINSKVENNSAYSEVVQNAGKMAWLVKSGTSAASMQLTPEALKIIAKNIDLTGLVTFNSLDDDAKKKIADAEKAGTDAQASVDTLKALDETLIVDVNKDTYFPYDSNLCTTSGKNPSGKAFLIEQGKFGKAMSVMDKVVNLWSKKGGSQSVGWSIITDTPDEYVIRYDFKSTQAMAYSANPTFSGDHLHKYTFSCWMYVSNDCNETTAPVISGESNTSFSIRYDMSKKGTWQFLSSTITPTTTTSSDGTVTCTIYFLLYPHQGTSSQVGGGYVLYRNPQVVQCAYASNFYWGEKSPDEISYDITCPDIFTMSSYKKNICDPGWYHHALTKNGNTFTYYINGSATDIYKNKWARYICQKTASAISSNDITTMINPSERMYLLDITTILTTHSWNATHVGYMFRSFIYCSEDVIITRNMNADNYGAAYCNGNRIGTATYISNTPMIFNFNKGWNCVELCYSDGDTGGGLSLLGSTFFSNSSVLYMTAEIPIEFSENKVHFLPRANSYYDEMFLSSRLLTAEQIKLIYETSKRFNDPSPVLSVTDPYDISFTIT